MTLKLYYTQQKQLEKLAKKEKSAAQLNRYRIILSRHRGLTYEAIYPLLGTAPSTIGRVLRRFSEEGVAGLRDRRQEKDVVKVTEAYIERLSSRIYESPRTYGWQRSTWTRELLSRQLAKETGVSCHASHIGRLLVYPIIYFDALVIKSRESGPAKNKSIYLALGVNLEREKELLGMWLSETEGASFWQQVFTEMQSRGAADCFVACVDGLVGLPEAIEAVYPRTQVQLCIVHKVRNSLRYVPWKERKAVAKDLRAIYSAPTLEVAERTLEQFSDRWDEHYPAISPAWKKDWQRLTVFFDYPPAIRKVIYTTNAIESLNYSLRKVLKTKGVFPNDDSIKKVLYLAFQNIAKKWTMPIQNWKQALNQFVILLGEDRVPLSANQTYEANVMFLIILLIKVPLRLCASPSHCYVSRRDAVD